MEKIKVAAYCRVSTKDAEQATSYQAQFEFFQEFCNKENRELVEVYGDEGISATKIEKREEFKRMLYDAGLNVDILNNKKGYTVNQIMPDAKRTPKFKYIYVKNIARFSRNLLNGILVINALTANSVYVIFLDYMWSTENEGDLGRIRMFLDLAEEESRAKSRAVKWGFERAIEKGTKIHTTRKLYGYTYIQEENRLEINEDEAEVIRLIFDMYSKGMGTRRIANYLDEQGYKTRQENKFNTDTLFKILRNEKYVGVNNRGKYETGQIFKNKSWPKIKEDYKLVEMPDDKLPAIVDAKLFEACQQLRDSKVTVKQKGVYIGKSDFHNIFYCEKCGSVYYHNHYEDTRKNKRKPKNVKVYDYYMCSNQKKNGTKACDAIKLQTADVLTFFHGLETENFANTVRHEWNTTIKNMTNLLYFLMNKAVERDNTGRVNELNSAIADIEVQRERLLKAYMKGIITESEHDKQSASLKDELKPLQDELAELLREPSEYINMVNKTLQNIESIQNVVLVDEDWMIKRSIPKLSDSDREFFLLHGIHHTDTLVKEWYNRDEIIEQIGKVVVHGTSDHPWFTIEGLNTTKAYAEFIDSFDYDMASIPVYSDEQKEAIKAKYDEAKLIYQAE